MNKKNNLYKKNIFRELILAKALSCAELSERTGKSTALTIKMLNEMIDGDLVTEGGLAPSSGGRRPLTYSLKAESLYIVAVAVDQLVTRIAIVDANMAFAHTPMEIELRLVDNSASLETLAEAIQSFIGKTGINRDKIIGIGIGMPGFVDAMKGINHTYFGKNINEYIKSKTGLPVFIENDSSTIALAEYISGAAKGESHAMIVNISWEIGLGMIINDKLFRGNKGFAGEFGHIPLFLNGKLCSCGKIGCLETETSLNYMLEAVSSQIESGKDSLIKKGLKNAKTNEELYQHFIESAKAGDSVVVETISDAGYKLGRGIATLIHILNPGKIVLTGRCAAAGKIWLAPVQKAINEFCIPQLVEDIKVEMSTLNHTAEIIGAAILVIENIGQLPLENLINISHSKKN